MSIIQKALDLGTGAFEGTTTGLPAIPDNAFVTQVDPRSASFLAVARDYIDTVTAGSCFGPGQPLTQAAKITTRKVFVVHGHDEDARHAVARFLEKLQLEPVILQEQPGQGCTIIEQFEEHARDVGFAVVLLTPDDLAGTAGEPPQTSRARQNVIFE